MSIFAKPLSQLQFGDLDELLHDGSVENARLEFKRDVPDKDETLKKLSSVANTFGGFMVVGAKADSKDGRIQELSGVDPQNGYKQKIQQWSFDAVSPPLIVEVSDPIPVNGEGSKVCYVVAVPESDTAPHFLNGRKGVWVRTDEFSSRFESRLADENELKHLFDRRKLVIERRLRLTSRAKKRFDTYVAMKHTTRSGDKTTVGPVLEFGIVPRFPSRQVYPHDNLSRLIQNNYLSWRNVMFPDFTKRQILLQDESAIVLDAAVRTSLFEITTWGSVFYGVELETDHGQPDAQAQGIHTFQVVGYILLFINHAVRVLRGASCSGPLLIEVAFGSILGLPWLNALYGTLVSSNARSVLDDDLGFSIKTTVEELSQRPDAIAIEIIRRIFLSVNWPELVDTEENRERLIRSGYNFNSWGSPTNLRT